MQGVKKFYATALKRPQVVATVHSAEGLRIATRLGLGSVDILEVRVDALAGQIESLRRLLPLLKLPVLLTVRHPAEGGLGGLGVRRRRELFAEFLPYAALVDVELRSVAAMDELISAAKGRGAVVVISDHHFLRTPSLAHMREGERHAFAAGADVFKLATTTNDARSLARLLEFSALPAPGPRAVMGMGKFGQVSRLALACAGSILNYGYLDKPNAPGQWEARELRALIHNIIT